MASQDEMSTETFRRPDRCGQDGCPTKRYYEQDGQIWCTNGHAQGITVQHAQEEEDYVAPSSQGQTTRIRIERRAKQSRIVGPEPALQLYLICYQHLLQLQCQALIEKKGVNAEVEHLVRDLWELRLVDIWNKVGKHLRRSDTAADTADAEAPLLYSSQGESTTWEATDAEDDQVPRREKDRKLPSITDSLSLCYIALLLLRIPVSVGELHQWAIREEIPYIRPLRYVADEIQRNLPTQYLNLLETHHALRPDDLHHSLQRLISQYGRSSMNVCLPPLNYQPLLFWYTEQLALPPQIYMTVQHLAEHINIDFAFPQTRRKRQKGKPRPVPPELCLVSLIVIAVKSYHPFPPCLRCFARSVEDPAFLTIDWSTWLSARKEYVAAIKANKPFLPGEEMYLDPSQVFSLTNEQMDAWMDWYGDMYPEHASRETSSRHAIPQDIKDMFPTSRPSQPSTAQTAQDGNERVRTRQALDERLAKVVGSQKMRKVVPEDPKEDGSTKGAVKVPRVGDEYQIFLKEQDLAGSQVALEFHEAVAERAAVSVERLLKEVRRVEVVLEKKMGRSQD